MACHCCVNTDCQDFASPSQRKLIEKVLIKHGLMYERPVQDEFLLPGCLPVAHCGEEIFQEMVVLYLDLGGLLSPNFFPALAQKMHESMNLEIAGKARAGAPQVFRNRLAFFHGACSVSVSIFPVGSNRGKSLRVSVQGHTSLEKSKVLEKVTSVFLHKIMKFDPSGEVQGMDPVTSFGFEHVASDLKKVERELACRPCLNAACNMKCPLCRLQGFLHERSLPDLSSSLCSIVEKVAFFPKQTRPAGSFRFTAMKYPGDVDLEEYLVVDAANPDQALQKLSDEVQEKFKAFSSSSSDAPLYFAGLKAGKCKQSDSDSGSVEFLTWNVAELSSGKKVVQDATRSLSEALKDGHHTWTAKIDMFAKVHLFHDSEHPPRFFEVTNVLRAGFCKDSKPIQPLSHEKDFLQGVHMNLDKYTGKEPNAMKFVKRLWERSSFLAQRGFDLDWHLGILEALKPLLGGWVAELSQVSAHIETLINMIKSDLIELALTDLPILRPVAALVGPFSFCSLLF